MRKTVLILVLIAVAAVGLAQRPAIAPLLTSEWGQHEPYNQQCPYYYTNTGNTYRCNVGCVAVSMAQVMYYYRYPAQTKEDINGYTNLVFWTVNVEKKVLGIKITVPEPKYATLKTIPAGMPLFWASMTDTYKGTENDETSYAVSWLMLAAGESVAMKYDRSSSTDPRTISSALINKFGYAETVHYVARTNYPDDVWEQMLYDELAAGRPVIYGGLKANGAGHSFVLDGYKDGLFHVNWGDDGYYNDYFSLNAMDPYAYWGGTNGYNFEQDAIIGIQPPQTATAVHHVEPTAGKQAEAGVVYNLQGRCVKGHQLRPGIYIVNGKKIKR